MKKKLIFPVLLLAVFIIMSCGPSVTMQVMKPSEVNMGGARTIAIFEVDYPRKGAASISSERDLLIALLAKTLEMNVPEEDTVERRIGRYTTDNLVTTLLEAEYFDILSPKDVSQKMIGADNPNLGATDIGLLLGADAIIMGSVDVMESEDETYDKTVTKYDSTLKKNVTSKVPYVKRTARLVFSYRVILTNDGRMLASKSFDKTETDEQPVEKRANLQKPESLYQRIVDEIMPTIRKQIAPYTVNEYWFLMKDKTKDARMEQANNFVNGSLYDKALDLFLTVWQENENVAAGYNAAIMFYALGDIDTALEMMERVLDKYPEKDVMNGYTRLKDAKSEMEQVADQMG